MEKLEFKINNKIQINNDEGRLGVSLVQDFQEDYILVTIPLDGYKKKLLHIGQSVTGVYYDNDKIYMFTSKVLDRMIQNIPLFKLSMPKTFKKVQRREYVRLPVAIPILYKEYQLIKSPLSDHVSSIEYEKSSGIWEKGTVLDISGGGIYMDIEKPLEENKQILIQIDTEGLQICVKGELARSYSEITSNKVTYRIGVRFIEISEGDRDRIIGFIFRKLSDMRQKDVLL